MGRLGKQAVTTWIFWLLVLLKKKMKQREGKLSVWKGVM